MMNSGYKNIFSAEPVQWAVDYLLDILETLEEAPSDSEYGLGLLALEREEMRSIWQQMTAGLPADGGPVICGYGREGARLFVLRQLLAALPAVKHCPLHGQEQVFRLACKRLVHEFFFLSGFRLALGKNPPTPALTERALRIVSERGLSQALRLNGHPLHLYCLDYELPDTACYLYPSHTIVCGATDFEAGRQLHVLLHELGHAVYAGRRPATPPASAAERKKTAERFANRFAVSPYSLL
jgi:hypothetical protein